MKNLLLMVACVCIALATKAQFTTGQKMVGLQLSGGANSSSVGAGAALNKAADVGVSLSFSKFKTPTTFNSIGISYGYAHTWGAGTPPTTMNSHSATAFVDRTKLERLANRFYFSYTGAIGVFYQYGKDNYAANPTLTGVRRNSYGAYASGNIGLLYQLNDRFVLTAYLSNLINIHYQRDNETASAGAVDYPTSHRRAFRVSTGFSQLSLNNMSIGFKYLLKN